MLEPDQIFAGRYRVLRELAHGGMGVVFEAEHTGTEQRVALKVLFPHIMRVASVREKFELEAKVAARVKNEHIVHVLDAGFDEGTRSPYLVMELLNGATLSARVASAGLLGARETVALLRQVALGLDAAHGFRDTGGQPTPIVHRDLKPDNLILHQRADGSTLVKILDFGIAKVLSETRNVSHEVRGTPIFMAYEQVAAARLSPQTDIWALGLIAYYALTGKPYWKCAEDPNAGLPALFAEIAHWPMEPASVRMKQQGTPLALPEAFDAWLAKCLDRVAERRFASAGAAIDALERALRGTDAIAPTEAAPQIRVLPAPTRTPTELSPPALSAASTASSFPAIASGGFGGAALHRSSGKQRLLLPGVAAAAVVGVGLVVWSLSARVAPNGSAAPPAGAAASAELQALPPAEQRPAPAATVALPIPRAQERAAQPPVSHAATSAVAAPPEAVGLAPVPVPAAAPGVDATAAVNNPRRQRPALENARAKASKPKLAEKPKAVQPQPTEPPRPAPTTANPFDLR